MDTQKDMPADASLFDAFEHPVRTDPFGSNKSAHRVYRRIERVVAALYLITNHVPSSEPIRIAIRSVCTDLMSSALGLRRDMSSTDSSTVSEIKAQVRNLISLTRILTVAQMLSSHNADVVVQGLDDLSVFIDMSRSSPASEHLSVTREDFLDITHSRVMDIKDTARIKDIAAVKDGNLGLGARAGSALGVREQHVLAALTGAGELSIRDIVSSLPEYSEKMIQRELASLVSRGRVKKTGSKRWSRYSVDS